MDLNKYLKEPEKFKPDFGWWINGESFDVEGNERNPHECKDELAMQWGNDGFVVETDDNNIPVARQSRKATIQESIILQTRSMMNAGIKTASIREFLAKHQKPELIKACSGEIDRQLKLEGSVGRFVLDARGYKNCAEAMKYASKNPFRKYMSFIIGCTCGEHIKSKSFKAGTFVSTGDPIGDSLCNDSTSEEVVTESCPKSGMQILSGQGDVDASWAGDTMIDVMNACDLDKDNGKPFTASSEQPYLRLKKFFIALDEGNFVKNEEDFDIDTKVGDDINSAPLAVKVDDVQQVEDIDINKKDNESICFKLNKDAPVVDPLSIQVVPVLTVSGLEKDIEPTLPVELPIPETNTFEMNREPKSELSVNNGQAPVVVDDFDAQEIMDVEFGISPDDKFFQDDGVIDLEEKPSEQGMSFSF